MSEDSPVSRAAKIEPLSVLWRILLAPPTLMALLGLLALVLILSTLLPQIPTKALGNPDAWLATQSGLFANRNGLLRALGLFDLYDASWFRLLLALIGVTLAVWAAESADLAWRVTRGIGADARDLAFWGRNPHRVRLLSPFPPEETLALVGEVLRRHGYRWTAVTGHAAPNLVAGRRTLALWAQPVAYAGALLALGGVLIAGPWGWQSEYWQPAPGESLALGHGTAYSVRLDRFDLELDSEGRARRIRSEISWLDGSTMVGQDIVEAGQPARLRGIALRLLDYAPAVELHGVDAVGRPLTFQAQAGAEQTGASGEVQVIFSSAQDQPLLYIPDQDLFLVLSYEVGSTSGPAVHLDLVHGGAQDRRRVGTVQQGETFTAEGLRVEADWAYRPTLQLDHRPGLGVSLAAAALALLALIVGWIAAPRLAWLAIGPGEEDSGLVQILPLSHARADRWAAQLAEQLQGGLTHET